MNLEELETSYRREIDILGNKLQNTLLSAAQTEALVLEMRDSVENINRIVADFIAQQRQRDAGDN